MIIVKVMGGLGNQFFTYATAYAVAKNHKKNLLLDEVIYQTFYSLRQCQLHQFQIDCCDGVMKNRFGQGKYAKKIFKYYHKMMLKLKYRPVMIDEEKQFEVQHFQIDDSKNYYMSGYWQNYRYFDSYREELIRQFQPKQISKTAERVVAQAQMDQPIVMHIRRGDYKTFQGGKCLSLSYYRKALSILREKRPKAPVWVITDDIEYCKQQFSDIEGISFVGELAKLTDIEEFWVMSHCYDFVIANSSFSWWAAYLCANEEKKVIAPVVDMWKREFYLEEWDAITASLE